MLCRDSGGLGLVPILRSFGVLGRHSGVRSVEPDPDKCSQKVDDLTSWKLIPLEIRAYAAVGDDDNFFKTTRTTPKTMNAN